MTGPVNLFDCAILPTKLNMGILKKFPSNSHHLNEVSLINLETPEPNNTFLSQQEEYTGVCSARQWATKPDTIQALAAGVQDLYGRHTSESLLPWAKT